MHFRHIILLYLAYLAHAYALFGIVNSLMIVRKAELFSSLCLFYRCNYMCDQFANKPQWNRKPSLFTSKRLKSIIESALAAEKCKDVWFICQVTVYKWY